MKEEEKREGVGVGSRRGRTVTTARGGGEEKPQTNIFHEHAQNIFSTKYCQSKI